MSAVKKTARTRPQTKEQQLEAARLNNWADMLLGIPFRHGRAPSPDENGQTLKRLNQGVPLPRTLMTDMERAEIANYLRGLARNSRVIDAKLAPQRRRGNPGNAGRVWSIALDYEVTRDRFKLEKKPKAYLEVMRVWKCRQRSAVTGAYTECKKHQGWQHWASLYRQKFPELKGVDLLRAISDELRGVVPVRRITLE
jgi:hypothetical protein